MTHETAADGIDRRLFLRASASAGALAVAGCLSNSDDGADDVGDSTPTSTPEPTPTPTPAEDDSDGTPAESADDETDELETDLPITGEEVPELAAFDDAMIEFMEAFDLKAGVLGVANDGDVVFERGYGWRDPELTEPLDPDAIFRIGSISKPITDAAIVRLAEAGEISGTDEVLTLLDIEAPDGEPADERFQDVTVEHLLTHRGGWDSSVAGDPMFEQVEVATELDLEGPPDKYDITEYMLDQPMQFDPGSRRAYSNFGYSLLGQVIEVVTGTDYQTYVEDEILGPEGIEEINVGRTRPENRPADEVWYDAQTACPSVFELDTSNEYHCADTWFDLRAFDSTGGHVSTTRSLLQFLDAYWLTGDPRGDGQGEARYQGSLPGSFATATQRPDGVDYVAMFNGRELPLDRMGRIDTLLGDAVEGIDEWP